MDIAFQLLKERKMSPEAKRHKLEYDTKCESSPVRVKYREELNRERRRRGIYGSGDHKDVSHTEGGKLTLEGEHANRARHFKNRGTLRKGQYPKDDPRIQGYIGGDNEFLGVENNIVSNNRTRSLILRYLQELQDGEIIMPHGVSSTNPYVHSSGRESITDYGARNQIMEDWLDENHREPRYSPSQLYQKVNEENYHKTKSAFQEAMENLHSRWDETEMDNIGLNDYDDDEWDALPIERRKRMWDEVRRYDPTIDLNVMSSDPDNTEALNAYLGLPHDYVDNYGSRKVESTAPGFGNLLDRQRSDRDSTGQYPDATGGRDWEEEARIQAEEEEARKRSWSNSGNLFG